MRTNPIRDARRRLGLSQGDLGKRLGVSRRTICHWEAGTKVPEASRADALRKELGLSEVDLWRAQHHASPKAMPERKGSIW